MSPPPFRVRHVRAGEAEALRTVRLAALATDPAAFGSTHAQELAREADWWESRARLSDAGLLQRTFVLVQDRADPDGEAGTEPWLGMALARLDDEDSTKAVLNGMWVAPRARGQRAARMLCDACAGWAAARGCRELRLDVLVNNHAAQRAYAAAGFVVSGRDIWHGAEGRVFDHLVLTRALGPRRP